MLKNLTLTIGRVALTSAIALLPLTSSAGIFKKSKAKKPEPELTAAQKDSVEFSKSIASSNIYKGMFTAYLDNKEGKLSLELPDSVFGHTYLLSSRVTGISNTGDLVAGEMHITPLLVRFSKDSLNVYMHTVQSGNVADHDDAIKSSFDRNFINPVLKGFKIKNHRNGSVLIDVTSFFAGNEKVISPLKDTDPISKVLSGRSGINGTYYSDGSSITSVKSFPENIEIESRLAYTTDKANDPYTVMVSRSILKLPDNPMRPRLQDNRVGYFSNHKKVFSSKIDKVDSYDIINRFRVEPKEEDIEAYFAGKLVEPKNKIIFYVDSAFPEKWRGAVKEGIEYWNTAFEAAGFKNAVEARDYPKDDPTFDPDDVRYNCIRYCVTSTANAMGPSYVDPRTGEIIGADVIWYHNVISLVHDWRFAQTAAVDPRVREKVFADSVMHESLTYVTAHEVGHCFGLMHNMGASYAFTIDNLRDPAFTQKHGTTPSIMDYARNNFVAQPGDRERGVRLTPPPVGVYDIHAINWGYRLIPGIDNFQDERATLNKWIREKDGDPMYEFGAQQFLGTIDPSDQTEDLGNDHIKAGDMAISNLKIIMDNFEEWAGERDRNYESLLETYKAVVSQYARHIGHVYPYIGGVIFKEIRQGNDDGYARNYIPKKDVRRAMDWLLAQARDCDWLTPEKLTDKFESPLDWREKVERSTVGCLLSPTVLNRIKLGHKRDPRNNYSVEAYFNDAMHGIFDATYKGKALNDTELNMQSAAIAAMINYSGIQQADKSGSSLAVSAVDEYEEMTAMNNVPSIPCSHSININAVEEESRSFFRLIWGEASLPAMELRPMMTSWLQKILTLYRSQRNSAGHGATRDYYDYQIRMLNDLLNPK